MLQKSVVRALFGVSRKERVALFELQLPLPLRVSLLNECIQICKLGKPGKNNQSSKITEEVAVRAYNRIVGDRTGKNLKEINLCKETIGFPKELADAIDNNGYIDKWASQVQFDHTMHITSHRRNNNDKDDKARRNNNDKDDKAASRDSVPKVTTKLFEYGKEGKLFWFMTIDNAFSNDFWREWIRAIDEMRFCVGLRGKGDAYVRCSSAENGSIFTTGERNMYHTLPMTDMEEKILRLAKFVMSFQQSYVHRIYGDDYKVTWDANLLHHVVGPIAAAVYNAHSDSSPLLNSASKDEYQNVQENVYLPVRGEMQVLTVHYSNYENVDDGHCTTITYTCNDEFVGSAPIGSKGIHIQGPGSQAIGMKHATTISKDAMRSGNFRCICTTRLSISPRHREAFQKALQLEGIDESLPQEKFSRNVDSHDKISVLTISKYGNVPHAACRGDGKRKVSTNDVAIISDNTKAEKTKRLRCARLAKTKRMLSHLYKNLLLKFSERYPNIPPKLFDEYKIDRGVPTILIKDRVRQLTTARAMLCLLKNGYRVYIRRADGNIYPCIYDMNSPSSRNILLNYGHRYPSSTICADADVRHKDRSHVPIGTSMSSGNIIILSRKYKQAPKKIDALILALNAYNTKETDNYIN
jgi:hypothetical protein